MAPLAIGGGLICLVYAGGHISGAHYNPAVTLCFFIRGRFHASDIVPYWIAQITGAVLAALTVQYLRASTLPEVAPTLENMPLAFVAEFLFTFLLCFVILNVATAKGTEDNLFYGMAIGFTVLAGAYAVGNISGGAFNPAVAIGGTLMKLFNVQQIWVHIAANLAAAVAAALVFLTTHGPEEAQPS